MFGSFSPAAMTEDSSTDSAPTGSRHPEFYTTTVIFLVEGCLFRVPREPLEEESTVFGDMFLLPQGDQVVVEGLSDENPIVLQGIDKGEFEPLLKVLLYRKHGRNPVLSLGQQQWISVLKLSTMWEFDGPRNAAIHHLDSLEPPIDPVEKVVLAMQYDIKEWLLPALLKLAQRPEPISIEEGRRIGFETTVKLAAVREKVTLGGPSSSSSYCYSCGRNYGNNSLIVGQTRDPATAQLDFSPVIQTTFDL
ncbi:hypothetical protein J3A83DRAFT_3816544 [Scleroderma citrinum]